MTISLSQSNTIIRNSGVIPNIAMMMERNAK